MYVYRGIESNLINAVETAPVVVLEGARAVGKSTTADELVRRGHLSRRVSLTIEQVRAQAERDPHGWVESLPPRTVIDEAQLVTAIPVAVKDVVDRRGGPGHFVLTGSASIGRSGLVLQG